jgi:choline dehydrogenase-like flavoprotein
MLIERDIAVDVAPGEPIYVSGASLLPETTGVPPSAALFSKK